MLQIFVNLGAADSLPLKCRGGEGCCGKETSRHLLWSKIKKSLKNIGRHLIWSKFKYHKKKTLAGNAGRGRATATPIPTARGSSYVATTTADPRGDSGTQRMTAARKGDDFFLVLYLQLYYYYFVSVFVSDWSSAKPIWVLQTNKKLADGLLMK